MKKIGDIMMELGFNKEAPDSIKEAFIRHLVKKSEGVELAPRVKNIQKDSGNICAKQEKHPDSITTPIQLEFDFYKKTSTG